ncbi:transposase, partial [Streptomyces hesseae]|uniref:transposase n=1 Tax=Streptomyces hesseae TaxID=3075519 RepID=UPI0034D97484
MVGLVDGGSGLGLVRAFGWWPVGSRLVVCVYLASSLVAGWVPSVAAVWASTVLSSLSQGFRSCWRGSGQVGAGSRVRLQKILCVLDHGVVISRHELSDAEWELLAPLIPSAVRGRPRVEDRRVINGMVYKIRTG